MGSVVHPILVRIAAGQYSAGLSEYTRLSAPTPEEDRYAAICLFNLRQLQAAKDLLLRARALGCAEASIELATVYRHLGQLDLSNEVLAALDLQRTSHFDRALALRERGAYYYTIGELANAVAALERAWAEAAASTWGSWLRAGIGQALGLTCAERGLDRRATEYFEVALESANAAKTVYLRAARALSLSYVGELQRAREDIEAAEANLWHVPLAAPYVRFVLGVLLWASGAADDADAAFAESAALAREAQEPETECYAELGRCAIATARGRYDAAQGQLARAEMLVLNTKMQALVQLRHGVLAAQSGQPEAVTLLVSSEQAFERLGLARERAWTWLQLAEARLRMQQAAEATAALRRARALEYALGSGPILHIELHSTPRVAEYLVGRKVEHALAELTAEVERFVIAVPGRLEFRSLGRSELLLDGTHVRFDMRRTLEVLAYLLRRSGITLDRILLDLFPDQDADNARNYFHQVRYELGRKVARLSVPFDQQTRTYSVHHPGVAVCWDAQEVRQALALGGEAGLMDALKAYPGPLLPNCDGEWIRSEREELALSVAKLGLDVMRSWYAQGRSDKCLATAGRLLEIDPYDDTLIDILIKSAMALEGEASAQRTARRIARRYEQELGVIPPALARLRRLN
jgi:tetratricopeptide (TPR) repeat protein